MPSYSRTVKVPGKSAQELYDKVAGDIERFLSKGSLPGSLDIDRDPERKQVHVKHSMVTATLLCADGQLQLDAKLSLLATPFRSKLDEGIDRWLEKALNIKSG
jgi:hypothetical protein